MTVLGYPSTVPVTVDEMLMLSAPRGAGFSTPMLVGDLPFGSYEASNEQAIAHRAAVRQGGRLRRREARARRHVGGARAGDRGRRHPGDGPRRPHPADGDRPRRLPLAGPHGRARDRGARGALALQDAGCFAIVFEAVPSDADGERSCRARDPVIGIGAGPETDGQVLVFHDLLGIYDGHAARFVKRYADSAPR